MCKHSQITITEYGTAVLQHDLENGSWSHNAAAGSLTGTIDVHCYECGLEKTYHFSKRPKWLVRMLEEMGAPNNA